ncbi:NAD(P)-binding protein [Xylariaceae sp. FL1651]|nr:NAD(P)-binding protein [Xylariaceae sp. FL1651]
MDFSRLPANFFVTLFQYTKNVHNDQYPSVDPTRQELNLAGKVVIVTGASRGLGAKAFAPAFAKAGVKGLVLIATNSDGLKNTEQQVKKINSGIQTLVIPTDISDESAVASAFSSVKAKFGHANILINNAGANSDGEGVRIGDADPAAWWRQFEINGKGTFLITRAFINQLPTPETRATIINLTTGAAWKGNPMMPGYSVSKLVAQQQIPSIAAVYPNITAVALHPGLLDTDMLPNSMRHFNNEAPELVGGVAVWLSHPHAHFLSGRVIASQWDVDDLLAREDDIRASNDLTLDLVGKFGPGQFA